MIMRIPRRRFLSLLVGAAASPVTTSIAQAQSYPIRPISMIVPFAAGGPTDVVGRIVGEHMSRTLRQQIVENVVGAGGTTSSIRAMRANPDGYTIEMGHMGTHASSVAAGCADVIQYGAVPHCNNARQPSNLF
jgi:tripartite-type tricarboxylate transporter receptor subunit TctC